MAGARKPKPPVGAVHFPPGMLRRLEEELRRPGPESPLRERFDAVEHNLAVLRGRCSVIGPEPDAFGRCLGRMCGLFPEAVTVYLKEIR